MSTQHAQYVLLFLEQYSMLNGLYAHNVHVFLRNTAIYRVTLVQLLVIALFILQAP